MSQKRRYTGKRWGDKGQYASKQEMKITEAYPLLEYHPPIQIRYTIETYYEPDWRLGIDNETGLPVYVEGKELFTTDMCLKYESVVDSNPRMILLIVTPHITFKDMRRMNAHPRIEVILSQYEIPERWFERTRKTGETSD